MTKEEKAKAKNVLNYIEYGDYHKWRFGAEYRIIFNDLILVHKYNQWRFSQARYYITLIGIGTLLYAFGHALGWI